MTILRAPGFDFRVLLGNGCLHESVCGCFYDWGPACCLEPYYLSPFDFWKLPCDPAPTRMDRFIGP